MSQPPGNYPPPPPLPPPLAGYAPAGYVPPPPPGYAVPLPIPMPVPAYPYEPPAPRRPRRPGMVTAMGVLSIVVGLLGVPVFAVAGAIAVLFYFFPPPTPLVVATRGTVPPERPPAAPVVGADGLADADRQRVAVGLVQLRVLTPARREQLDAILAQAGRLIFPSLPPAGEAGGASVKEMVLEHGGIFSADPDRPGPDFFRTAAGRLELYDDRAVFYPDDGSDAVRASAYALPGSAGLSPDEVGEAISEVRQACTNAKVPLNPQQLATIEAALQDPSQDLITTVGPLPLARGATGNSDGSVTVRFRDGDLTVGAAGQIFPGPPRPPARPAGVAVGALAGAAFASAALAVFLVVAGIMALRRSKRAARLHRIYARAQGALALAVAVGAWWTMSSFADSRFVAGAPLPDPVVPYGLQAVILAALLCVYPAFVMICLRTRTLRGYYGKAEPA